MLTAEQIKKLEELGFKVIPPVDGVWVKRYKQNVYVHVRLNGTKTIFHTPPAIKLFYNGLEQPGLKKDIEELAKVGIK